MVNTSRILVVCIKGVIISSICLLQHSELVLDTHAENKQMKDIQQDTMGESLVPSIYILIE